MKFHDQLSSDGCLLTLRPSPGGSLSFVRPQANQVADHHHKESPMFDPCQMIPKIQGEMPLPRQLFLSPKTFSADAKKECLPILCKTVPDSLAPFFVEEDPQLKVS